MSLYNNTLEFRKYKHLNEKERYRIEILLKEGFKPYEIA
jgi:IS30 family transposase